MSINVTLRPQPLGIQVTPPPQNERPMGYIAQLSRPYKLLKFYAQLSSCQQHGFEKTARRRTSSLKVYAYGEEDMLGKCFVTPFPFSHPYSQRSDPFPPIHPFQFTIQTI